MKNTQKKELIVESQEQIHRRRLADYRRIKQNMKLANKEHNAQFAGNNDDFRKACEKADIPPTRCQAGKWRRKVGKAWQLKSGK